MVRKFGRWGTAFDRFRPYRVVIHDEKESEFPQDPRLPLYVTRPWLAEKPVD